MKRWGPKNESSKATESTTENTPLEIDRLKMPISGIGCIGEIQMHCKPYPKQEEE